MKPRSNTRADGKELSCEEGGAADPGIGKSLEILLISARDGIFLASPDAQTILSCQVRLDFFDARRIHQHRAMNLNESVRLEFFRHHGDRFAQQVGRCSLLKQYVVSLSMQDRKSV